MIRHITFLLLFVFMVGCATDGGKPALNFSSLPKQDREIYITVFEKMFDHWSHPGGPPRIFFLSLESIHLDPELLIRFRGDGHNVEPGSKYRHGLGIHCSMGKIQRKSKNEAKVWGGYLFGDEGGEWGYFMLKKEANKWRVVDWHPELLI